MIRPRSNSFPLSAKDRFTALQSGEVDVLARNTTWTVSREAGQGLLFTGVNYYDGQGFHGAQEAQLSSALELVGRLDLRAAGHDDGAEPRRFLPLATI